MLFSLLLLFTITSLVNSALLFMVEPMFAKMILPLLGGSPSVWNTCLFFFQATLLAGYAYAHVTTTWLEVRIQAALHVVFLFLLLFALPIGIPTGWSPPVEKNPVPWLLMLLLMGVGIPFSLLSSITPMLQKWFANTEHPSAKDPYFLYGASNLGSMLALLGYPTLMEPNLRLPDQSWAWAVGYGVLLLLTLACALMLWRSPLAAADDPSLIASVELSSIKNKAAYITTRRRLRWVTWSFVPSSLTLAVTTHLTTDITPMPLFWVIPLALYLLTFVLVFARTSILPHGLMVRLMPFVILSLVLSVLLHMQGPLWLLISLHLLTFSIVAMVCHGELARSRPPVRHLTEFYLWISVGGVLGGLFNALVAPMIFDSLIEYPLVLVFACLLRPASDIGEAKQIARWLDFLLPLGVGLLVVGSTSMLHWFGLKPSWLRVGLTLGLSVLLCFSFRNRPVRFGLGVGAMILASAVSSGENARVLERARSFFGVYRVVVDTEQKYHLLIHGRTSHGQQSLDPSRRNEPLSYYYRTGPMGQVFKVSWGLHPNRPVAIIGLGTGSMACYGQAGQPFTFYEIDPLVEQIARNPEYFTFLRDCPPKIDVVLGDARLSLTKVPDRYYGLIVVDAFSSDAIPAHLATREAVRLYLTKLRNDGILAFHISNRTLNLRPVFENLARDLDLVSIAQDDLQITETEQNNGKSPSQWVVMARNRNDLAELPDDPRWRLLPGQPGEPVWTDDFSNILSIIRWK
jgi:hypothetical protein